MELRLAPGGRAAPSPALLVRRPARGITALGVARALLFLSTLVYSIVGFVVVGGVPLYVVPMGAGCLVLLAERRTYRLDRRMLPFLGVFLLYVLWALAGVMSSEFTKNPLSFAFGLISGLGLLILAYNTLASHGQRLTVVHVYTAIHLVALLLGVLQVTTGLGYISPSAYKGTGAQPAGFEGMTFSFGKNYLPIFAFGATAVAFAAQKTPILRRNTSYAMLAVALAGILISDSRSTQLGAIVGAFLLFFYFNLRRLIGPGLLMLAVLLAFTLTSEKFGGLFSGATQYGDESSAQRVLLLVIGVRMFMDHPWAGVGGGNFKVYFSDYFPAGWDFYSGAPLDPHNLFLGILTGLGVIGFALFSFVCVYTVRLALRTFKNRELDPQVRYVAFSTYLFLVIFAVDACFHNYFDDNNIWLFLGLFYATMRQVRGVPASTGGPAAA